MKMNEIIREKRLAKGFTQEKVASAIGVSTPAVNKWEKGSSYPDITLLPALARLLDTDLNTLLSFQEDMSEGELTNFLNELSDIALKNGMEDAFAFARKTLREFPSNDVLLLNTALTLEGLLSLLAVETESGGLRQQVEDLLEQAAESTDPQVERQAKAVLISKYIDRGELERAEMLLKELPEETLVDPMLLRVNLCLAQGNLEEAARLTERKLLADLNGIQSSLVTLMEIAFKENRGSDLERIADSAKRMTSLFDLWDFGSHLADFQLSMLEKNGEKGMAALEKMLPAMKERWNPSQSPFYRHIPGKEGEISLRELLLPRLLNDLADPNHQEYAFLQNQPRLRPLIDEI